MAFCNMCGTQIADGAATCAACAGRIPAAAPAPLPANTGGLTDNIAGMLAYFTFIPAVIFLVIEPYNRSRFVRFHSWQSLLFSAVLFVLHYVLRMFWYVPILGWLMILVGPLVWLTVIVLWIFLLIKANQGQMYKLPVIGDIAEKQANAM